LRSSREVEDMMLSFSRFEERCRLAAARGGVQRRGTSGVELRADCVADALLDEAEQFGFDVVAGELERELLARSR
jgi:hypothetical protein